MKVCVVFGTRPCIIKLSPIIRYLEEKKIEYFCVHTGQHYSYELDKIFFEELELPHPKYTLNVKSLAPHKQGHHTGKILLEMEDIVLKEMPNVILIHGDTNTALGGALLASKISTTKTYTGYEIKIGHVESGLRSYDRSMPEEINRVICDHLSDYLFAPTQTAKENLLKEGILEKRIVVTGNTIVDSVIQNKEIAKRKSDVLKKFGLKKGNYVLVTVHRQENVDSKRKYENVLEGLVKLRDNLNMPIIYPLHPRAKNRLKKFKIQLPEGITFTNSVGFLEFLELERNAKVILTDSGGVQEESCILQVPCVTLRENTERPETLDIGCNVLAGTNPENILKYTQEMITININWSNPFGKGDSGKLIVDYIIQNKK